MMTFFTTGHVENTVSQLIESLYDVVRAKEVLRGDFFFNTAIKTKSTVYEGCLWSKHLLFHIFGQTSSHIFSTFVNLLENTGELPMGSLETPQVFQTAPAFGTGAFETAFETGTFHQQQPANNNETPLLPVNMFNVHFDEGMDFNEEEIDDIFELRSAPVVAQTGLVVAQTAPSAHTQTAPGAQTAPTAPGAHTCAHTCANAAPLTGDLTGALNSPLTGVQTRGLSDQVTVTTPPQGVGLSTITEKIFIRKTHSFKNQYLQYMVKKVNNGNYSNEIGFIDLDSIQHVVNLAAQLHGIQETNFDVLCNAVYRVAVERVM